MIGAQDVGAFRHEVHAAENDVLGFLAAGGLLRKLQRIAAIVGELDDLVALVMVAQDHQARAERRLGARDALVEFLLGKLDVGLGNEAQC